ncbi:MAG TPA: hypothetical protein PLI65_10025 [Bacteroidales bacterium]|nr:hypothetical protein [Bacteroidales bacterium]
MKRIKNNLIGIFLVLALFFISAVSMAQTQAPPPPGHGGSSATVPGGSAPVGEGIFLLITLGAAYGARKVYNLRRKLAE